MRLNTRFFKRCGKSTDSLIRIFAVQQIHLLKSTAIRFRDSFVKTLAKHFIIGVDFIPSENFWVGVGFNPQ